MASYPSVAQVVMEVSRYHRRNPELCLETMKRQRKSGETIRLRRTTACLLVGDETAKFIENTNDQRIPTFTKSSYLAERFCRKLINTGELSKSCRHPILGASFAFLFGRLTCVLSALACYLSQHMHMSAWKRILEKVRLRIFLLKMMILKTI